MNINERRLRKLFGAHGFRVREIRNNKHWVATVERNSGGPQFNVVVARTPSDGRFPRQFVKTLRRVEREAASR
jgi:hypothetical protein